MRLDYSKLFKLLIDRRITRTEFREQAGLSSLTVSKFFRGENMNTENILRVCAYLNVQPGEIMEYVREESPVPPPSPDEPPKRKGKGKETKSETETEEKPKDSDADRFNPKDTFAAFGEEFELPAEEEIFKRVIDGKTKYAIMPKDVARFLRELELKLTHALEPWDKEATEQKRERIFDMYYSLTIQRLEKLRTEGKTA